MVKIVIFFKRKPGMTVEAFQEHWRTTHAAIISALPGIRRYVQNATLASGYRKGEPAFDAVAESWFDDTQAMKTLARTPEYAKVLADEPNTPRCWPTSRTSSTRRAWARSSPTST
jgi:uncharacterized protein (TIGR02118 family)